MHVAIGLAETGRYGKQSLHWPPGAPGAFAAAAKVGGHVEREPVPDIPAAYWVQWAGGDAADPAGVRAGARGRARSRRGAAWRGRPVKWPARVRRPFLVPA